MIEEAIAGDVEMIEMGCVQNQQEEIKGRAEMRKQRTEMYLHRVQSCAHSNGLVDDERVWRKASCGAEVGTVRTWPMLRLAF